MMKLIKVMSMFFVITSAITCQAQVYRSIEAIIVEEKQSGALTLTEHMPADFWTMIIVDKNLKSSHQILDNLKHSQLDLNKIVLVIIGNQTHQKILGDYQTDLPVFAWLELKDASLLRQLKLSTTPVVLGMKGPQVKWKVPASLSRGAFKNMVALMNKWSSQ